MGSLHDHFLAETSLNCTHASTCADEAALLTQILKDNPFQHERVYRCFAAHAGAHFEIDLSLHMRHSQCPQVWCERNRVFVFQKDTKIYGAPEDIFSTQGLRTAALLLGQKLHLCVADPNQVRLAIYRPDCTTDAPTEIRRHDEAQLQLWFRQLIERARHARASDIYLEKIGKHLNVRFRIDGTLWLKDTHLDLAQERVALVKTAANLDVNALHMAQDGRIRIGHGHEAADLRVATMPIHGGESLAIRILDPRTSQPSFDHLNFPETVRAQLCQLVRRNSGLLLATGPTGSGKTTTLHCTLNATFDPGRKILTIEDPVEYILGGAVQTEVNAAIGNTFSTILRSFLRHDPDTMLIGEIRDAETAQIAVQAALTGHMVLSTLHAGDCIGAILRLCEFGIDRFSIANVLDGVINQRLVRLLCPKCKEQAQHSAVFQSVGCPYCAHTGYYGRQILCTLLLLSEHLRALITEKAPQAQLLAQATHDGMQALQACAQVLVDTGLTSPSEIARII